MSIGSKTKEKNKTDKALDKKIKSAQEQSKKISKKKFVNFEFLQKLGKAMMVVIAVMPAAGLMISLGSMVQIFGKDNSTAMWIGNIVSNIGWGVINNLSLLFAVAIGGSWAKERAGGAFAASIAFILINLLTGSFFGVTSDMLTAEGATTHIVRTGNSGCGLLYICFGSTCS